MSERWTRRDFIFRTLVRMGIWKTHGHLKKRNGSGPGDCGTGSPWLTRYQNGVAFISISTNYGFQRGFSGPCHWRGV